jgi:3-phenylpropionate/trans-cinnamate dioxygenase ferredoxin subunit
MVTIQILRKAHPDFRNQNIIFNQSSSMRIKVNGLPPAAESSPIYSINVQGEALCVTAHKGHYYAFRERCPHAGASMRKGWCTQDDHIVCPLHDFRFNLKTGIADNGEGYRLGMFPMYEEQGQWYIEWK